MSFLESVGAGLLCLRKITDNREEMNILIQIHSHPILASILVLNDAHLKLIEYCKAMLLTEEKITLGSKNIF